MEKQSENLRLKADMEGNYLLDRDHLPGKAIGIFYAPPGGSVHKVARLIKQKLVEFQPEMHAISEIQASNFLDYHTLILVSSTLGRNTWEMEQKDPWSSFLPSLYKLKLNGRKVAIVGLGDHVSYPNNFVDGIRILADVITEVGGCLIGSVSTEDYIFNDSKAVCNGKFIGLPLDEDYEAEKTAMRVDNWLRTIKTEIAEEK